jgi:hypothetical protein
MMCAEAARVNARPASPPRVRHPRNLVIVRAGDESLHREWIELPARDFDLFISYYGKTPWRHCEDADFYESRPGPKWPCIAQLLQDHAELLAGYENFWFPDDDLSASTDVVNRMFAFFNAHRLSLAQPALTRNSHFTWRTLLQEPHCHLRHTRFIEVMAPIFSRDALRACAPTFTESPSGWGLDWVWPGLCDQAGLSGIAVLDATPVCHTRPVGGPLYLNHPELNPRADAERVIQKYGLQEVRAVAKYAVLRRVKDVPLPWLERLVFWFKRANGRRKHLG